MRGETDFGGLDRMNSSKDDDDDCYPSLVLEDSNVDTLKLVIRCVNYRKRYFLFFYRIAIENRGI